ncbi:Putative RNA polymerase ECF-subfamily sigma factor (fragment) [Frankia canadensis]|uniref:RNA polymerase ECF-subfamily sigma factor n=1 Tax=Frankia canadensis TaxID=1836972 RepID=A0A2I2KXL5_9ACTN
MEAVATDDEHEHPPNQAEFRAFFESHHRELSRFAYLLTGDRDAADDITADALTAAWSHWDRVRSADLPLAYVRRIVANLAADRVRRAVRERRGLAALGQRAERSAPAPDVPAVVDLRTALMMLPPGKRACVVLRYAFDLSEGETARTLGISVGTVKSQTARGVADLERILQGGERPPADTRAPEVTPRIAAGHSGAARGGAGRSGASRAAGPRSGARRSGRQRGGGSGEPAGPGLSTCAQVRAADPIPGQETAVGQAPSADAETGFGTGLETAVDPGPDRFAWSDPRPWAWWRVGEA